jgi:hypothetical protein
MWLESTTPRDQSIRPTAFKRRRSSVDLGSTEERVLISVNKYKARLASLRQILDEEFS